MSGIDRRRFLEGSALSTLGVSLRAAITGLPVGFLLEGSVRAAEANAKIMIMAASGQGEPLNVNGPGTYEDGLGDVCRHPKASEVDAGDVGTVSVNGVSLTAADLEHSAELRLGSQSVRMANAYAALPEAMLAHTVWFNYRTPAGIHPQYSTVRTSFGELRGETGRGSEDVPSAIAQETASLLGTTTAEPFVLSGSFTSNGSPLATYRPTEVKSLAASVGRTIGGPERFGKLYEHYIDQTYGWVRAEGTAEQRRFMDQYASSRRQAAAFGEELGGLLEGVTGDGVADQFRTALAIAKLRLAPVVVTNYEFGGDNHSDSDLTVESTETLRTIAALNDYWQTAQALDVVDEVVLSTVDVFGRSPHRRGSGRGHYGDFTSGLIVGTHLAGGVIGGFEVVGGQAKATGINAKTGHSEAPDITPDASLSSYYKSLMLASGIPSERRDARLPGAKEVTAVLAG